MEMMWNVSSNEERENMLSANPACGSVVSEQCQQ